MTMMLAVALGPLETLAVMIAVWAPSESVSLIMFSGKLAKVEPAGMVTLAKAGLASVVSLDERFTVTAEACAGLIETVPARLPADSTTEAGTVIPSVKVVWTLKLLETPVLAPLAA